MFALTNLEDQAILIEHQEKEKYDLEKQFHECRIKSLARKQYGLRYIQMQRSVIQNLHKEIEVMTPSISTMYSSQSVLKDHEIRGYLVYLLHVKDFFTSEVATKKLSIRQRKDQINATTHSLNKLVNDYARRVRKARHKTPDWVLVGKFTGRLEQTERKLGMLKTANDRMKDDMRNLARFRQQQVKYVRWFQKKLGGMKIQALEHLNAAVAFYQEREDHMSKARVIQQRCDVDMQRALVNQNMLQMSLSKQTGDELFRVLQQSYRKDVRVVAAFDVVRSGQTGLEPKVQEAECLQQDILAAAGSDSLQTLRMRFRERDGEAFGVFAYLEEVEMQIKAEQRDVWALQKRLWAQEALTYRQSTRARREAQAETKKADDGGKEMDALEERYEARCRDLRDLFAKVEALFRKSRCDDDALLDACDAAGVIETNAVEFLTGVECRLVELAMLVEYVAMEEENAPLEEDKKPNVVFEADDPLSSDPPPEIRPEDAAEGSPRTMSRTDTLIRMDLETATTFLSTEQLKAKVRKVMGKELGRFDLVEDDGELDSLKDDAV